MKDFTVIYNILVGKPKALHNIINKIQNGTVVQKVAHRARKL